jgi:hypothetical protein
LLVQRLAKWQTTNDDEARLKPLLLDKMMVVDEKRRATAVECLGYVEEWEPNN